MREIKNLTTLINMKLLVLLLHSTSLSKDTFLADWNDKQNLGNLISDVKYNHHGAEISVI